MEPMKPMKPMAPMAPMKMATEAWWPAALGAPSSAGSSNDVHYAYFAGKHRLAVRQHDHVRLFDTDGKHLSGLSLTERASLSSTRTTAPSTFSRSRKSPQVDGRGGAGSALGPHFSHELGRQFGPQLVPQPG
jgi:hypothetical protein